MPRRTRRITQPHAEVGEEPKMPEAEPRTEEPAADEGPLGYPVVGESISVGVTGHTHEIEDGYLHCPECIAVLTAPEQP